VSRVNNFFWQGLLHSVFAWAGIGFAFPVGPANQGRERETAKYERNCHEAAIERREFDKARRVEAHHLGGTVDGNRIFIRSVPVFPVTRSFAAVVIGVGPLLRLAFSPGCLPFWAVWLWHYVKLFENYHYRGFCRKRRTSQRVSATGAKCVSSG